MSGGSTASQDLPSNNVAGNDQIEFALANEPERVVPIGTETTTVAIVAHPDNSGLIFIGFDDEMTSDDTIPLQAGASMSVDIDANQQGLFALADTIGDEIRWMAVN